MRLDARAQLSCWQIPYGALAHWQQGKGSFAFLACPCSLQTSPFLSDSDVTAVVGPIVVGFILGPWALAAYLIAVKIVGATLATFMFNAGGAWDNAKKSIENGLYGGKQSEPYRASVVGDTVGDPLKDAAGPSLHILIKLQNILAITLLPLFLKYGMVWK